MASKDVLVISVSNTHMNNAYAIALPKLFPKLHFTYNATCHFDMALCVGNINDKFVSMAKNMLQNFPGKVYALPQSFDVSDASLFDFVLAPFDIPMLPNSVIVPNPLFAIQVPKKSKPHDKLYIGLYDVKPDDVQELALIYREACFLVLETLETNKMLDACANKVDVVLCGSSEAELFAQVAQAKYLVAPFTPARLHDVIKARTKPRDINCSSIKLASSKQINVKPYTTSIEQSKPLIAKFLGISAADFEKLAAKRGPFKSKDNLKLAMFICYVLSHRANHPGIWGLAQNMRLKDFCLDNALKDISVSSNAQPTPCPYLGDSFERKVLIDLDPHFDNDFVSFHRSGWPFAIGGLQNLNAANFGRHGIVVVDSYVDRTFHWGLDTMKALGMVPYTQPWVGFVHHTFDKSHSTYNCCKLLETPEFVDSLKTCKGLITLSKALADKIKTIVGIPVYVVDHPTEFVENTFTMQNFLSNPNKKIVQIGAWLRNPYAIYQLDLGTNQVGYTKCALKGKEMDQYFPPSGYVDRVQDLLLGNWDSQGGEQGPCRPGPCRPGPCRSKNNTNKYCEGAFNMLLKQHGSVVVIDKLDNDQYDDLLSSNIVFLNLIDCSAVNTVIECIVRNTPLFVNRLPALEEVLGKKYPGFYDNLAEAANMCNNITIVGQVHTYLTKLDKTKFTLETFVKKVQEILLNLDNPKFEPPELPVVNVETINVYHKQSNILRFLPGKFWW